MNTKVATKSRKWMAAAALALLAGLGAPPPAVAESLGEIDLRARCAVVRDAERGTILFAKNERQSRPIASITKLATAITFLRMEVDLHERVAIDAEDIKGAWRTIFEPGETVALSDVLFCALLASDNVAARTLARATGLSRSEFAAAMNREVARLGLVETHFVEPTGLDGANVSTALDCAALIEAAADEPLLRAVLMTSEHSFRSDRRLHRVSSTNELLHATERIVVGKTGFIRKAGYCFAASLRTDERALTVVVLGAYSSKERFLETRELLQSAHALNEHQRQK